MKISALLSVALVLFVLFSAHAQSQGCLYNSTLYPTKNGTIIVNQFGACPANTAVYSGSITMPYVTSQSQCPGSAGTAVLGSQYTGPGQTKCVIYFSGTGSFVCSDVYNYVECPLDDFVLPSLLLLGSAGFLRIARQKKRSAELHS